MVQISVVAERRVDESRRTAVTPEADAAVVGESRHRGSRGVERDTTHAVAMNSNRLADGRVVGDVEEGDLAGGGGDREYVRFGRVEGYAAHAVGSTSIVGDRRSGREIPQEQRPL